MVESSLLEGGKQYDLLINWNKRIKTEIPFVEFFLKQTDPPVKDILEIGCGTGHHAKALLNLGYNLTGIDIDKSMIEEAKKRAEKADFLLMDFLDSTRVIKKKFNAIISLGNSIGLIASSSSFNKVINRFTHFLYSSNSIIIFHLLNTEKERVGWSNPRYISNNEGEFLFLRGFSTSEFYIHPEILTLFKATTSDDWILYSTGKANIPRIKQKEMNSLLEKYGFYDIQFFGNYRHEIFDPINSIDMITVARY